MCVMAYPLPVVTVGVVDPATNNGLNSYTRVLQSEIGISVSLVYDSDRCWLVVKYIFCSTPRR